VLNACQELAKRGCELTILPVDGNGLIDPADVKRALRPTTKLITIMMANNETGVIEPVEEIGRIAAEADVYFHTDAVQAAGKIPIDVKQINCDLLSLSGHKIHAPQGIGALYVRKGTLLKPLFYGGTHERSRRPGTENVAGIVALGKAADLAREGLDNGEVARLRSLRDHLERELLANLDEIGINSAGAARVPTTSNIHFDHVEGEALVIALDLKGLAVSTGAACSSGAIEPSHVLTAIGLPPERARASLRFSLGKQNTAADVDFALSVIPDTLTHLRQLSPLYKKQRIVVSS
jgi:cysteine desulfurase